jgi:hypothetical protein
MTDQAKPRVTIKARVIDAGSIPRCDWQLDSGHPDGGGWVGGLDDSEETPPRVLLELSEEDCRKLARYYLGEITLEIVEP